MDFRERVQLNSWWVTSFKNYETIFRLLSPDESESESCDRFAFFFFDFLSFFSFLDLTRRSGVSSRVLNLYVLPKMLGIIS